MRRGKEGVGRGKRIRRREGERGGKGGRGKGMGRREGDGEEGRGWGGGREREDGEGRTTCKRFRGERIPNHKDHTTCLSMYLLFITYFSSDSFSFNTGS